MVTRRMGIMDIVEPIGLFIGVIVAAALIYALITAIKSHLGRGERNDAPRGGSHMR